MKARTFIHGSRDNNRILGEQLGLADKALQQFKYAFYEFIVDFEVDPQTGMAKIHKITYGDQILEPKRIATAQEMIDR